MQESSPANSMTQASTEAPVQTRVLFDFKAAHDILDKALEELHEFYPSKDCPYGPKEQKEAEKLILLCEHVAVVFYDRKEGEVLL